MHACTKGDMSVREKTSVIYWVDSQYREIFAVCYQKQVTTSFLCEELKKHHLDIRENFPDKQKFMHVFPLESFVFCYI